MDKKERSRLKLIRRPEVERITGLKRSSIYAKMDEGTFPQSIKIGSRAVAWLSEDIDRWIQERIASSRGVFHEEA